MKFHWQTAIKGRIEKRFNCKIYRYSLPRGVDFAYDTRNVMSHSSAVVIFDVGANIGQSVYKFREKYPTSKIFCFEPVTETYKTLCQRFGNIADIVIFRLAVGDEVAEKRISINDDSSINSFIRQSAKGLGEQVSQVTLDHFCDERGINDIDILKIDVEGYELQVLNGCKRMLKEGRIKFLYLETALRNEEDYFVPLASLDAILQPLGFDIFGIYEQQPDVKRKRNHLYFCNVAYVRRDLAVLRQA
jgi:FkbM family methyltransferase